jgi:hypothetical protein
MEKTPDMRAFNASVADDHRVYDACLATVYRAFSAWTWTEFTDIPVTAEHFVHDTRARIVSTLRSALDMPGIGTGKSFLPTDMAFRMVEQFGQRYHVQRESLGDVVDDMQRKLRGDVRMKTLVLMEGDAHPLASNARARNTPGEKETAPGRFEEVWQKTIDVPREDMRAISALASMSRDRFTEVLRSVQPFLLDLDDAHVHAPLADLRRKMRERFDASELEDEALYRGLFTMAYDDWKERLDMAEIDWANDDLVAETGDPRILEADVDVLLRKGFIEPLSRDEEMTPDRKQRLQRRRVILESIYFQLLDTRQRQHDDLLAEAYVKYVEALGATRGQLGHLGALDAIMTNAFTNARQRRRILL